MSDIEESARYLTKVLQRVVLWEYPVNSPTFKGVFDGSPDHGTARFLIPPIGLMIERQRHPLSRDESLADALRPTRPLSGKVSGWPFATDHTWPTRHASFDHAAHHVTVRGRHEQASFILRGWMIPVWQSKDPSTADWRDYHMTSLGAAYVTLEGSAEAFRHFAVLTVLGHYDDILATA